MSHSASADPHGQSVTPEDLLVCRRDVVSLLVEEGALCDVAPTGREPGRRRLVDPGPESRERIELGLIDCIGDAEAAVLVDWLGARDWTCEWELTPDVYCRSRRPGAGAWALVSMMLSAALLVLVGAPPAVAIAVAIAVALLVHENARRREARERRGNVGRRRDRTLDRRFRQSPLPPQSWQDPLQPSAPPDGDPDERGAP